MALDILAQELIIDESAGLTDDDKDSTVAPYSTSTTVQYLLGLDSSGGLSSPELAFQSNFVVASANAGESISSVILTQNSSGTSFSTTVGVNSGIQTVDGNYVWLFQDATHPNVVIGVIGTSDSAAPPNLSNPYSLAFSLALAGTDATHYDLYAVEYVPLSHPDATNPDDQIDLLNKVYASVSGSTTVSFTGQNAAPGKHEFYLLNSPTDATKQILVTGFLGGANAIPNVSTQGFGVDNQSINPTEKLQIDFVTGGTTPAGSASQIQYGSHVETITQAGFTINQITPSNPDKRVDITITASNVTGNEQGLNFYDGSPTTGVDITSVILTGTSGYGSTITADGDYLTSSGTVHVSGLSGTGGAVTITGLDNVTVVNFTTSSPMDRLSITGVDANEGCDITEVHYSSTTPNAYTEQVGSFINFDDDGPSITASISGAPNPTVDETNLLTNDSDSFAAQFSPVYGVDGQAATPMTYALSTPGGDSGLIDTATGNHVFLFLEAGQVVGRQGTSSGTAATGDIVFVVSVNSSGSVSLDQQRAIVHPTSDPDESKTLASAGLVVLTGTVHDGDGDSASAPLNIGTQLIFNDDGPSITASISGAPSPTVDETALLTNDSDSFAAQFSPVYGADGQAATPMTYALSTPGGDSGLIDTATGNHVFLFLESGQVVGRQGADATAAATGDVVFVVGVNSSGSVSLDQQRAIVHPTSDPDESKTLASAGLVVLTGTAHDKDGDTASAPLNIGTQLIFKDDGPSVTASISGAPSPTVDETNLLGDDSDSFAAQFSPGYGADGQGASPIIYALSTPGGDSGLVDTATGNHVFLFLEAGQIVGRQGTDATAAASGDIVFVASVDASGSVSLDQQRAIVHPTSDPDESKTLGSAGLVVLTATVQDKDGDTASAPLNIGTQLIFKDDGPAITGSTSGAPSPTVDESAFGTDGTGNFAVQFTPTYGADGQAATPVTYALSTPGGNSGLVDTATGQNVVLSLNGSGQIEGRTATSNDLVLVISVSSAGVVTLDGKRAVTHLANSGTDQSTTFSSADLVVLTATAHDKDGDSASKALAIGTQFTFNDDAPTITDQILGGTVHFAADSSGILSHTLNGAVGADVTDADHESQLNVKQYTIVDFTDVGNSVYPNLDGVLSADGTTVTYYSTNVAANQNSTTAVYQLTLDQTANGGAGGYTFTVLKAPPNVQTSFGFEDLPSGQNLMGVVGVNKANVVSGSLPDGGLLVFSNNLDINAADGTMTNTSGTVNTSKGGGPVTIGNTNQAFDHPGEGTFFCYVDNPLASSVGGLGLTQVTADDADTAKFNGTNDATTASVEIVQASGKGTLARPGPAMHIFAYDSNPGNVDTDAESRAFLVDPTAGADRSNIIGLKIYDSTGTLIEYRINAEAGAPNGGTLQDSGDAGTTITSADDSLVAIQFVRDSDGGTPLDFTDDTYSVIVSNLKANYTVEFVTEANHNLALVENVSGSFDIGGFNVSNNVNIPAQDFNFQVQITDFDNDVFTNSLAQFSVHVDGLTF
jgi:hypothetical protein